MNLEFIISVLAIVVAIASAGYTRSSVKEAKRSADAAEAQVAGQRESSIAAAQPFVWADVRGNEAHGQSLVLVVGNSGPTVAENIRVTFDPPLPRDGQLGKLTGAALDRLSSGISSLAPGHSFTWPLGLSSTILESDEPQAHQVSVEADGPFGQVPPLKYVIDLADFRESLDNPTGTLHKLTKAVDGVTEQLKKLGESALMIK